MAITKRTPTVVESASTLTLAADTSNAVIGDLMVITSASAVGAIITPTGWQVLATPQTYAGNGFGAWYRFKDGTSNDTPTLSSSEPGPVAARWSIITESFGGVDTTTPIDVATQIVNTGGVATNPLTLSGVTTVTDGAMIISGDAVDASTTTTLAVSGTGPQGSTVSAQTGTTGRKVATATGIKSVKGASGSVIWTQSGTILASVGYVAALRPASGGGGGGETQLDITYVGSGAWAAGAASPSALNPTGLADGDKLYALVHSRESTTSLPATVGVWTKAHEQVIGSGTVGAGTGPTRFTVYEANATASMSGAAAGLTSLGTLASLVRVHAFRAPAGATGLTWSRAFAFYSHASSTNIGGTTSSSIALAAKDTLLVAHGSPDDTITSLPLTSVSATGITFGTITGGAVLASGTGNDHAAASYVVPVTAGSGTSAVTLAGTANAAETGGSIVLRIRLTGTVAVSPPVASAGADASVAVNTAFTRTGTGTNTPTSYSWVVQSGPANVGSTIGTAAALNWTPTVVGTYTLRFSATNAGGTGTDDLTLTVTGDTPYVIRSAEVSCAAGATANPGTLSQGATAGNLLVYALAGDKNTGTLTVTDNIGNNGGANPWSKPIEVPGTSVSTYMAWKVAVGGETTVTGTTTASSGSGNQGWITELASTASGNWGVLASSTPAYSDTTTLSKSTGTTGAATAAGLAIAMATMDTVAAGITYSWSNSYTEIGTNIDGSGAPAGLFLASKQIASGATTETTFTYSGTADQIHAAVVVFGKAAAAAPVASAGADASITRNHTFARTGSATNSPTSYAWTIVSGPAGVGSTIGSAAALSYTPTVAGTYVLRLTATNAGGSGSDDLTLTVSAGVADPTSITGLLYRVRPTNTQLANGAQVASLPFLVGNATLAQATAGSRPTLLSSGLNGEPALRFDGVDDSMVTQAALTARVQPITIAVILRENTDAVQRQVIFQDTGAEILANSNTVSLWADAAEVEGGTISSTVATLVVGTFNGASSTIHVNNVETATGNPGPSGIINATMQVGAHDAARYFPGDIYEILYFDHALTAGERATLTAYSADVYASPAAIAAPVANAGVDATINNAATFTRTGSGTNTPTSYAWTIVSGPTGVTPGTNIGNAAALSFTPTIAGTYVLRLTATNAGGSGTDDLTLTVNALANASTLTDDFATTIDTGKWSQFTPGMQSISGGRFTVVPASSYSDIASIANLNLIGSSVFVEVPTLPNVADGTTQAYFSLRNALDVSYKVEFTWINNNLVAQRQSGGASTQILAGAYNATNHRWWRIREASGTIYFDTSPDGYTWTNYTSVLSSVVTGFTPGAVEVVLGAGYYGTAPTPGTAQFDNLNLTVPPPVASAGIDANITLGATFSRTGSATNSPTGYAWTIVSGPAGVTPGTNIGNAAALSYQPTIVGTYVLRLTATNGGGSGTDDLTLTVSYDTPTTSAGTDAAINLGSAFNRTATEDAKTAPVTSRQWSIVSGPGGVTPGNIAGQTAAALSWTPTVAGTYVLRYTFVTDGGTATDDVQVVVTHQPPTANAGVDASTLVNQVFTRTGTDTGVNITARAWTIAGGPTGVGSTIGTAAALSFTPTQPGSYTLRYTVTNAAGSAFDEMILTVNGPPVVEIGANISVDNRVNVSRNATETGGGGVTAREWKITAGPQVNTVIGNTSQLDWTPTIPGTYTIQYSATNPYGTGTDTLTATVTAIVIGIASSSSSISSIVNPTLARRARITVAGTATSVSTLAQTPLRRVRKVAGTKSATSSFVVGKPRNVTRHGKTVASTSSIITAALNTRRTFKETVVEQASSTATLKLKLVTKGGGTATGTTPTVSSKLVTARKMAGSSTAISALISAKLRAVTRHARTVTAQTSALLGVRVVSSFFRSIAAEAIVRNANLGVQQQGAATASAVSAIEGALVSVPRLARTATAVSSTSRTLNRADPITATATANSLISQKLNGVLREHETIVQAGYDYTVQLGIAVLLFYEGMIARGVVYMEEATGILRQLAGLARAISQTPPQPLRRIPRYSRTIVLTPSVSSLLRRIKLSAGSSTAYSFVGGVNLSRLRTLSAAVTRARATVTLTSHRRITVVVRRAAAISSTSRKLNLQTRFRQIVVLARTRFQERSGFAALTTAKAVTTSPTHTSRYVKQMSGYVTVMSAVDADLLVAPPRLGYAKAQATVNGNLVRVDPIVKTVSADATARVDEKGVGKLSTIIRIFENEELDAYINSENYTGTNLVAVSAAPAPVTVFRRTFTRPR